MHLDKAIDEVRAVEAKELEEKGYEPVFTKSRWLLLKYPENLTEIQEIKLVEMSRTGELNFKLPQQEWTGSGAIQTAHFASEQMFMMKSDDQPENHELHYLGLKVAGFADLDEAKYNAPEFARSVLEILGEFIRDE